MEYGVYGDLILIYPSHILSAFGGLYPLVIEGVASLFLLGPSLEVFM